MKWPMSVSDGIRYQNGKPIRRPTSPPCHFAFRISHFAFRMPADDTDLCLKKKAVACEVLKNCQVREVDVPAMLFGLAYPLNMICFCLALSPSSLSFTLSLPLSPSLPCGLGEIRNPNRT